ncbi:MAG: chromosome segregation protein SMC [Phascolarctobacterium sp.]|nr:chromosome segregation protein SMC [Phascolarctobacterium sp.]
MRLKTFSTYGFKSFADKTELTFDKGITAVVGPNGSGKSNISDAIRWVLGEQSAKYLRGSKMEDVIFNGSAKRRALGVAEVTLNFDNSDHGLNIDFDEVSLTRRLYRSGDGEYAINKKKCRLKDIVTLMADTGLGKGSMSIVGQNKIDEILNSRPEERRALFEEAAGIAKYRLRKKEATTRLDEATNNLTRINDIKTEVDSQVAPLEIAAEKTRKFNALSKDQRACRIAVLVRKIDSLEANQNALANKKQALDDEYSERLAKQTAKNTEYTQLQNDLDELARAFNALQEEITEKQAEIERIKGEQNVLDERAKQSNINKDRVLKKNEELAIKVSSMEANVKTLTAEFDRADKKRAAKDLKVKELEKKADELASVLSGLEQERDSASSAAFEDMQKLTNAHNELRELEQAQDRRARLRESLKTKIDEAEELCNKLGAAYQTKLDLEAEVEQKGRAYAEEKQKIETRLALINDELAQIRTRHNEAQRAMNAAEAKENALSRMQASYEGFGYGIKNIMKAEARWKQNVIGVVAELIKVDKKFVTAIETALGEGTQNIVALDAETAKSGIAYLKQTNGGRATFLPLDTVQKRMPSKEEEALTKLPGVLGFAADLITYDKQAENAIRFLLGRVLIAEDIDAAHRAAAKGKFKLRVVTLEGDTVNAGGSFSGGSKKHRDGYLSRNAEIEKAQAEAKRLHAIYIAEQEALEEKEELVGEINKKITALTDAINQERIRFGEIKAELTRIEENKKRENENLELLLDERSAVTNEYLANRQPLKDLRVLVTEMENSNEEGKAKREEIAQKIRNTNTEITANNNQLTDAKVELESATNSVSFAEERLKNFDKDILDVQEEIKTNEAEAGRLDEVVAKCAEDKEKLDAKRLQLVGELKTNVGGKTKYNEDREVLINKQAAINAELVTINTKVSETERKLQQLAVDGAKLTADYEHATTQLADDYSLDIYGARLEADSKAEDMSDEELKKEDTRITLAIARLGAINPAAIEEYEAIKERSEFLNKQYNDLCKAKNDLELIIGDINSGMTKRFNEAFKKINQHFANCYTKLFEGGTAILKLTDPSDVLNAGIDIEAQPPGKKLGSLYLLSGGERALTVIALLFALLSYQPSPFCILDEIDAALDDANILRFSNFLKNYSLNTQFIVITHRKGTMECADILYGVTMEESGVSKLLSVKINTKENA